MNIRNWFGIILFVAFALLLLGSSCQETPKQDEGKKPDPVQRPYMTLISAYVDSADGIIHIEPRDSAQLARDLKVKSLRDSFWVIGAETLLVDLAYDSFGVYFFAMFPEPGDRHIYLGSYCGEQIPQRVVDRYERVDFRLWIKGMLPAYTVCAFHPDSGACIEVYRKLADVNYYRTDAPHNPDEPPPPDAIAEIGPYYTWICVP